MTWVILRETGDGWQFAERDAGGPTQYRSERAAGVRASSLGGKYRGYRVVRWRVAIWMATTRTRRWKNDISVRT